MFKSRTRSAVIGMALAVACAPAAMAAGQYTTTYDVNRVKFEVTGLSPGGLIGFVYLPDGFNYDALPWGVIGAGGVVAYWASVDNNGSWSLSLNQSIFAVAAEYAVYTYDGSGWDYHGITVPRPLENVQAPPVTPVGPDTIQVIARPGGGADVVFLNDPGNPSDDVVMNGGSFPLIQALRGPNITGCTSPSPSNIPPNDPVIGIYGRIEQGGNSMQIGGGDGGCKSYKAHWGDEPMRFTVIGRTPDAAIQTLGFEDRDGSNPTGGVEDARFENLTIEARYASCVGSPKHGRFGIMRFYNCHFKASPQSLASGSYSGRGYKFGIRSRGLGRYDIRDCSFEPVEEHCVYVDSPQGDSWISGIEHNGSFRTAVQVVNRAFDIDWLPVSNNHPDYNFHLDLALAQFESGQRTPQDTGHGLLLIENVTMQNLFGQGGAGITVAGHLGDIVIRNITAIDPNPFQGLVVVWADADRKKGLHLYEGWDGELYAHRSVTVANVTANVPLANRELVMIGATEFVRILDFDLQTSTTPGARSSFGLDTYNYSNDDIYNYQSRADDISPQLYDDLVVVEGMVTRSSNQIDNGRIDFFTTRPLTAYPGFNNAPKIKNRDQGNMSDAQIDARWPSL